MLNKKIILTSHALERAKQRINYNDDKNTYLFETYVIQLFKKANFLYSENQLIIFAINTIDQKIIFKTTSKENKIIIVTVLTKKH